MKGSLFSGILIVIVLLSGCASLPGKPDAGEGVIVGSVLFNGNLVYDVPAIVIVKEIHTGRLLVSDNNWNLSFVGAVPNGSYRIVRLLFTGMRGLVESFDCEGAFAAFEVRDSVVFLGTYNLELQLGSLFGDDMSVVIEDISSQSKGKAAMKQIREKYGTITTSEISEGPYTAKGQNWLFDEVRSELVRQNRIFF